MGALARQTRYTEKATGRQNKHGCIPWNPAIRGRLFEFVVDPGRIKLQFEINGKQYFLAFVEEERRWYVFSPSQQGIQRWPVYVDAPAADKVAIGEPKATISS